VNAISQISAEHLQDKLFTLSRLISGQSVKVVHGEIVASSHPEGIMFCKNLLAKKFVVSSCFRHGMAILGFFLQLFLFQVLELLFSWI
jgi:hypothetical protein